jgi:hypothetical protein
VKQSIVALDLQGVLVPEIWISVAGKNRKRHLGFRNHVSPSIASESIKHFQRENITAKG